MGLPFDHKPDKPLIHYTAEAIIEGLKASDYNVYEFVYRKYFSDVKFFVIKNSGTDEDAQDVFQEALILIYTRLKDEHLDLSCAFNTYLYSVCRFLWLRHLEQQHMKTEGLSDNHAFVELEAEVEEQFVEQLQFRLYQKHFQSLNKVCQEILRLFLKKVPLKEIANQFNYTDSYLKKMKYECKEGLIKRIQNDPDYKILEHDR